MYLDDSLLLFLEDAAALPLVKKAFVADGPDDNNSRSSSDKHDTAKNDFMVTLRFWFAQTTSKRLQIEGCAVYAFRMVQRVVADAMVVGSRSSSGMKSLCSLIVIAESGQNSVRRQTLTVV